MKTAPTLFIMRHFRPEEEAKNTLGKKLFIWQNGAGTQSLMNPTFDKHVIERQAKDTNQEIKERTCKEVNYIMKQNIGITLGNSV